MRPWVRRAVVVGVVAGVAVAAWRLRAARSIRQAIVPAGPVPVPTPSRAQPVTPTAAPTSGPATAWIDPDDAGNCPVSHPIKGKVRTGIFHPPGAFAYERTHADRCYRDAEAAEADGLRAAKR